MLVLSRKTGESIRIGEAIEVVVLGVSGGRVRLGFEGPRDIPVRRSEIIKEADRRQLVGIGATDGAAGELD